MKFVVLARGMGTRIIFENNYFQWNHKFDEKSRTMSSVPVRREP